MRAKFREEGEALSQPFHEAQVEKERLVVGASASAVAESPKTMTWRKAGKHTLRLSVLGFIILGLQHQYHFLGDWIKTSNMVTVLVIFFSLFGESGIDLDWRGRGRLFCSLACVVALLALFNQWVMGVPASETSEWMPIILGVNVGIWLANDGIKRFRKR